MQKSRVYKLLTWIVVCAQIMMVAGTATVGVVQPTPQMVTALAQEAGWSDWVSAGLGVLTRRLQPLWGEPAVAEASSIRDVGSHPYYQWLTTVHPEENLVVNGSFEMGPEALNVTSIPGWTVASGKVDLWNGYFNPDGSTSEIDLAGTPGPGVLEQTLTGLVAGQSYFFEFSYSANTFANEQAKVQVLDGATALLDQTVTAAGHPFSAGWQHFRQTFTAPASGSVKLRFQDLSVDPHVYHGVIIDDVRVARRLINYVLNHTFEAGPHGLNTTIIPNWTVESGRVDIHGGYFHPDRSYAELDLAGTPGPGIASQTVSGLTAGQSYLFEFDYTVNAFPNEQARVQVLDGATSLINQVVTVDGDANHKGWKHFRQTFTAPASGSVTLRFQDLSTDVFTSHGIMIDNVRVADEPLNYVVNGDFENSPAALNIANDAIPGWTVVSGPVDLFNPGLLYEKMVDLNGSPGNGKIEQLVTGLTAGQVYAFQFNYQNHASWTTYGYARLLDSANAKLYEKRISCKGHVVHEGWCTLRYTFTAPANGQVKIVFENDEADGNPYYGVNVDNVFISRNLNYVVNGNFASGPTGLNQSNVPGWSVAGPTDTHDNFGGEYRFTVDLNGSPGDGKLRQVIKGLAPGQSYTLRYNYASTAHNYLVNFDVKVTDSTGATTLLNVAQSTDQLPYVGGWKQAEHTFTAPADGIVQVNFNNNETDNNLYYAALIDNIQIWGQAATAGTEINVCNGTIVIPRPPSTTGPGGVTNGLAFWVRADEEVFSDGGTTAAVEGDGVQQWNDQAGAGFDLTQTTAGQKPTYRAGGARSNFNPALDFADDFIRNTSRIVERTDDLTFIAVGDTDVTGGVRTIMGMGDNYNDPTIDLDGTWISPWWDDGGGTVDLFNSETLPTNQAMIWGMRGVNGATNGMRFNYSGEEIPMNMTVASGTYYGQNVGLGSDGGGEDWDGRIPEALIYDRNLSPAEMEKVYSYLAIKYGITMRLSTVAGSTASGNYVSSKGALVWNYNGNSNYHNDVAGIARDDASDLEQKQSNSVNSDNLITIGLGSIAATNADNINNFTADQSFLLWGNNNGATTLATSVSVSLTRMARIWTVQETTPITAPLGLVTVRVPQSAFSLGAGQQAFLLRSDDPIFTNKDSVIFLDCDGTNCETTIDFVDGDYFTLARANVAPEINVTPGSSNFGNIGTTESSPVKNVVISNSGNAPLRLTSIQMTNTGSGQFSNNNSCGATLNPGASCIVGVAFTANASGAQSGVLTVASNDSDEATTTVNLSGTGVAQAPDITVLPTTVTFPTTLINSASLAQRVVITNSGTGNLAVQGLSLSGADSSQFILVDPDSSCMPLTKNLADGESCDVEVLFIPTSVGSKSASLVIGSNDTDEITTTVPLNGVATACSGALNTVSLTADNMEAIDQDNRAAVCVTVIAPPNLTIGKSGPVTATQNTNFAYTLVITNTGVAATSGVITVTDSLAAGLSFVSGSGSGFTCAASGQNVTCTSSTAIAANGTATLTLTVNPTTTGAKSNTASVVGGGDTSAATSNTVNTTVAPPPLVTVTVDKKFSSDNGVTFSDAITVPQGTMLIERIYYNNTSRVAGTAAALQTTLPAGLTLVAGSTKNCLHPTAGETVCNTDIEQAGAINEGAVWTGQTLTIAPTAGLFDVPGNTPSGRLEVGRKRYINLQECGYNNVTVDLVALNWHYDGSATPYAANTNVANSADATATCGPPDATYSSVASSNLPLNLLGRRYVNFNECVYLFNTVNRFATNGHYNGGQSQYFAGTNTANIAVATHACAGGDSTFALSGGSNMAFDLFDKRYFNLHECIYRQSTIDLLGVNGHYDGSNSQYWAGTNVSANPDTVLSCGAGDSTYTYRGGTFVALDTLDPARGTGYIEFKFVANTVGVFTQNASLSGGNFTPQNDSGIVTVIAPAVVIGKSGPASATQGTNFNYTLVITNTGSAATSGVITVTDNLPAGLNFVSGSGGGFTCAASGQTVTCTSSSVIAANNGTATITLTVNPTMTGAKSNTASVIGGGDSSAATSNTVNTTVNANATAPTITSGGGGASAAVSIPENSTVVTTVTASGTAPITYSIVSGADAAKFTINPNTGALSFVTAPDYEAPTDSGGNNVYEVTVRASNSAGTDDQAIAVTVTDVLGDVPVTLPVKVLLQGAYDSASGLLRDDLRSQNLLPATAPYAAAATVNAGVFAVTGNNAIVDWVLVELRDSTTPATVVTSKSALLQRDGDVVAVDGTSTLTFTVGAPSYYVVVKHRNHLGAMTGSAIALSVATPVVDLTNPATPTYGTNAQRVSSGKAMLWAGNANGDGNLIFAGPNNDRNGILAAVLGAPANSSHNANFIIVGYRQDDVNLDGRTIAAGPGNDINVIGVTVFLHPGNGSGSANYLLAQQLP